MSSSVSAGDSTVAALRRAGVEADDSARRRAEYSTDASLYRVVPDAVAFPRTAEDVVSVLEACRSLGVPLTARGAGTSIAGNAVGSGVVLDFSRHLDRIHDIDPGSSTAVVDPGVVLDDLQRAAAPHRLRLGPDPSTHNRCTIGGMIGNNACGSRALRYGRTADNVVELDVVTGAGDRVSARSRSDPASSPALSALRDVVQARLGVIRTEFGRFGRQVSGYSLEHLLPERGFNVASTLAGTEGSLGILLGATVRLVRTPDATALVVLGYPNMATAADAVEKHVAELLHVVRRVLGAVHRGEQFVGLLQDARLERRERLHAVPRAPRLRVAEADHDGMKSFYAGHGMKKIKSLRLKKIKSLRCKWLSRFALSG